MKYAILGTGTVGRHIAAKLDESGHDVVIGTRNTANTLAREEKDGFGNPPFKEWYRLHADIELATFANAAATADLIFNCSGGLVSVDVLKQAGEENLRGKTLIDIANPLDFSQGMPPSLNPVNTDSLGEQIQQAFPEVNVVKSLNTMTAALMVNPGMIEGHHNVFMCGNDEGAKQETRAVLHSFGWKDSQIIDLGDISNARGTEMLLPIWLRLWNALGTPYFNFGIIK